LELGKVRSADVADGPAPGRSTFPSKWREAANGPWRVAEAGEGRPCGSRPQVQARQRPGGSSLCRMENPPELGTVERAMKEIHEGRYVLIPYSDKTHGHFTHYYAAVWKPYLINFMGTLGPTAAAR